MTVVHRRAVEGGLPTVAHIEYWSKYRATLPQEHDPAGTLAPATTFRQNSWFSPAKIALTDSSQNTL